MTDGDVELLRCPDCAGPLRFAGRVRDGEIARGDLHCRDCGRAWPVRDGIPWLYDERSVRSTDWFMRLIYDNLAILHDPAVEYLLPVLQGSPSRELREGYVPYLELSSLRAASVESQPLRILEIGVGTGANLALLDEALPLGLDVEIWGCDLSNGMLSRCRRARRDAGARPERLLLADAHALPFGDAMFDRVFHVGGISGYRSPKTALVEMARVARPGTPIVVVDEQLDPGRSHSVFHHAAYFALTFYNPGAGCPRDDLPPEAIDVVEAQISRFYYCLRFRMPPTSSFSSSRSHSHSAPAKTVP